MIIKLTQSQWEEIGIKNGWIIKEAKVKQWIQKAVKHEGRFTTYCKKKGYKGACEACAEEAIKSNDASVRGMAQFYRNVAKKKK